MPLQNTEKKIIRELGINARFTLDQIAKKIGSKKEIVAYHIKKMEDEKIIQKYVPVFSQARLGITVYKIYIRFHGLTEKEEKAITLEFLDSPHINWIAKSVGSWDIMLALYCRNVLEFAQKKDNIIFKKYGKYIQDYTISILEDAFIFTRDYLTNSTIRDRPGLIYGGALTEENIDETQKEIIRYIRNNAKYKIIDMAKKLKINEKTAMNKIKDLEKKNIIQGYIVIIDQEKINAKYFKVHIYFGDFSKEKYDSVFEYIMNNKYVVNIMKSIGDWQIELEAEAETVEEIYDLAKTLRRIFPDTIKKIDLQTITKEIKIDYLPEWY
jgi:Lrp/AsnC family leucine-responsive transcriptional regulator